MNTNDIGFAYVSFNGAPEQGKSRPVFLLAIYEHEIEFFSISSKYEKKSDYIKAQYFEINEWQELGLDKPSWIDIGSRRRVLIDDVGFDFVGTLPIKAIQDLERFIINYTNNQTRR